jgi:hypothetical protein
MVSQRDQLGIVSARFSKMRGLALIAHSHSSTAAALLRTPLKSAAALIDCANGALRLKPATLSSATASRHLPTAVVVPSSIFLTRLSGRIVAVAAGLVSSVAPTPFGAALTTFAASSAAHEEQVTYHWSVNPRVIELILPPFVFVRVGQFHIVVSVIPPRVGCPCCWRLA